METLTAQTKIQMFYSTETVRGKTTPGLAGSYTLEQAISKLLEGTGLQYEFTAARAVVIKNPQRLAANDAADPKKAEKNKDEPTVLPEMTVTASPLDATSYNVLNATTATKTDRPIMETPFSIQVVPKQVLGDQQVIVLHEALKNVSGVRRGGDLDTGDSFLIRGFSVGNENGGLTLRDGFRRGAASRVSTANIERVEVLKGAAGSLYGRIEPGGIVNYVTKKPLAAPYYSVQQQFGSYDLFRTVADATGPLPADTDWLYRAIVSYDSWNSFRGELGYEAVFFAPTLTWKPTERTQFNLSFEYREIFEDRFDFGIPAVGNRPAEVPISRYFGVIDRPPQTAMEYLVDFNWSHQFNDDWSVRHKFAWWQYDATTESGGPIGVRADNETVNIYYIPSYQILQETYFTELGLIGHFRTLGFKHDVLLGGEWYRNEYPGFFQTVDSSSNPDISFRSIFSTPFINMIETPARLSWLMYRLTFSTLRMNGTPCSSKIRLH
ncbi:MAG: TonB-dependent siderophore receptor [Gammaproteobacteria bacterium]